MGVGAGSAQGARESGSIPSGVAAAGVPWLVSAKSESSLAAQVERVRALEGDPLDVGFSLATTRALFEHRAALLDGVEIASGLARRTELALLFSGQGAQRVGMGRGAVRGVPGLPRCVRRRCYSTWTRALRDVMWGDEETLNQTGNTQPALFAFEVALYRLLESLGVTAAHVTGHSIGEIGAAHIAGVFSLEDACTLVSARASSCRHFRPAA